MIRTLKFRLRYDPVNSRAIGYHATQQNAAYNVAVDVLNREPNLPKRSGKTTPDAINKRITAWRQANRQSTDAPYYIHQQGAEEAWEANQRLQQSRSERLERIAEAIANGEEPKQTTDRPFPVGSASSPSGYAASPILKWLDIRSIRLVRRRTTAHVHHFATGTTPSTSK